MTASKLLIAVASVLLALTALLAVVLFHMTSLWTQMVVLISLSSSRCWTSWA